MKLTGFDRLALNLSGGNRSRGVAVQALLAGGNWNNGANAGPGYLNSNNSAGNSNQTIGTHLSFQRIGKESVERKQPRNLTLRVKQSIFKAVLVGTTERSASILAPAERR